jgi:hypothetical protein
MQNLEKHGVTILASGLVLSLFLFLFAQVRVVSAEQNLLKGQLVHALKRLADAKESLQQVDSTIEKSEREVSRAKELESIYAAFLSELLALANTDPEARSIAQKWKIQHSGDPNGAIPSSAPLPPAGSEKAKSPVRR